MTLAGDVRSRQAEGGDTGTARRQRGRRLRPYLRYARMSVEMAFAECQHHSAQLQKKARIWEEEREVHYTPAFATTVPSPEPELFDLFEEPNLLLEPQRPQGRVQRNTVVHIVDVSPFLQILDVRVPQMGDQLVEFMKMHDAQSLVEQVIAVPKISSDRIPQRFLDRRRPQRPEQLVEVPTELAYVKQIVDILIPGGGGRRLQGFSQNRIQQHCLSSRSLIFSTGAVFARCPLTSGMSLDDSQL